MRRINRDVILEHFKMWIDKIVLLLFRGIYIDHPNNLAVGMLYAEFKTKLFRNAATLLPNDDVDSLYRKYQVDKQIFESALK